MTAQDERADAERLANVIEKIALEINPPNIYTPRFLEAVVLLRDAIYRLQQERDAATREAEALREEVGRLRVALRNARGEIFRQLERRRTLGDPELAAIAHISRSPAQPIDADVERARSIVLYWLPDATPDLYRRGLIDQVAAALSAARAEGARQMRNNAAEKLCDFAQLSDPGWQTQNKFKLMVDAIRALPLPASGQEEE